MSYHYWLLRYVPDAVRGEFINIGVIVGRDGGDWAIRRIHELGRANRLGGDPRSAGEWLLRLEHIISPADTWLSELEINYGGAPTEHPSAGWMDRMRRQLQNNVRLSDPNPVRATSANEAAEKLFHVLVMVPKEVDRSRSRSAAVHQLYEAMYTHVPNRDLQRHVNLVAGRQRTRFEFAVGRNRIAQLSQIWSFDVKYTERLNQNIQSSSYALARLRRSGGELVNPARKKNNVFAIESDVAVRVVYIPPQNSMQEEIFRIAEDSWHDLGIRAFPHGQEDRIALEARELVDAR